MDRYVYHIYLTTEQSYITVFGTKIIIDQYTIHIIDYDENSGIKGEACFYLDKVIGFTSERLRKDI